MDLDRHSIQKKDFPVGRRGYDPSAVDAHLAAVATELDALVRSAPAATDDSLASAASARVRAIVEAAEATAADIKRQGELEAQRIRREAERSAEDTRSDAVSRAESHVQVVSQATSLMLERLAAIENNMHDLVASLRAGAERLTGDLSLLEAGMGELYDASGRLRAEASPPAAAPSAPAPAAAGPAVGEAGADEDRRAPAAPRRRAKTAPPAPVMATGDATDASARARGASPPAGPMRADDAAQGGAARPVPNGGGGDVDGARLIALNMALSGQSREEADRYLQENFNLADRQALLDEVYSAVEG